MKRTFILNPQSRIVAHQALEEAPDGYAMTLGDANRSLEQNAKFHVICSDIARSGMEWAGKQRKASQWKVLLVSAHAKATQEEFDIVPGLEGEFVNLRESTALMSVRRSASLITYALAFCDLSGIALSEPMEAVAA